MKAIILAAGEGERFQPITATRPKHLIEIAGKPIIEHGLKAIKSVGVDQVVIVVHYMADAIRQSLTDGAKLGMEIDYVMQEAVLGTSNAVSLVEPYVEDDFLLVNGDLMFSVTALRKVIALHQKEKPATTMAVVPVEKPEDYGIVEIENEKYVKAIVEKPTSGKSTSNLANAGIYIFSTEIFAKIKQTSPSSRNEWEIPDALSILIAEKRSIVAAKIASASWLDIGRPWDLFEANRRATSQMDHRVYGLVENGARLVGPVTVAETAHVRSGAYIEGPVFIDEESDIGPNCHIRPHTSIGKKVRIGNACEVKNSIIMNGVHIGHLSYIGDSIIGEKCNLGAGTKTANYRFDAKTISMTIKGAPVDSGRNKLGVVLGDNVKTGINALFMPGVKIGNASWVGPNLVVHRDLPPNSISLLKQTMDKRC